MIPHEQIFNALKVAQDLKSVLDLLQATKEEYYECFGRDKITVLEVFNVVEKGQKESTIDYVRRIAELSNTTASYARKRYYQKGMEYVATQKRYDANGKLASEVRKLIQEPVTVPDGKLIGWTGNPNGNPWTRYKALEQLPDYEGLKEIMDKNARHFEIIRLPGNGIGVFALSDFHIGAETMAVLTSRLFNIEVVKALFREIVFEINNCNKSEIHLLLPGDLIESFTGHNHKNTLLELDRKAVGVPGLFYVYDILSTCLFQGIANLKSISIVSGNHDRTGEKREDDSKGGASYFVAEMLKRANSEIEITWNPLLISKQIDGINYIVMHGDNSIAKKDASEIILKYGKQDMFNLIVSGHQHDRYVKKRYKKNDFKVEDIEMIVLSSSNYRVLRCPPLFTGGFFSESLGYDGEAGFLSFENNGRGKPHVKDFVL